MQSPSARRMRSNIIRTAPPNYPLLRETIQALDIRPAQVLFEVTVAEITLGRGDEYGIDWEHVGGSTQTTFGNPVAADSAIASGLLLRFISLRNADIRAVLRAIASRSKVRVLSTPELLAMNNREARVLVGSRVPFGASTRLGNDVTIDRSVQFAAEQGLDYPLLSDVDGTVADHFGAQRLLGLPFKRRTVIIDRDGRVYRGVDAFRAIWQAFPASGLAISGPGGPVILEHEGAATERPAPTRLLGRKVPRRAFRCGSRPFGVVLGDGRSPPLASWSSTTRRPRPVRRRSWTAARIPTTPLSTATTLMPGVNHRRG